MKFKKMMAGLLIAVSLLAVGCQSEAPAEEPATTNEEVQVEYLVKVNDTEIGKDAFMKSFIVIEKTYNDQFGEDIWTQEVDGRTIREIAKEQILNNLVLERLIVDFVEGTGFQVEQADVDDAYAQFEGALEENPEIKTFYADNGLDATYIKTQIRNQFYAAELDRLVEEGIKENSTVLTDLYDTYTVQVLARHILVSDEAVAQDILTRLEAGEDFSELAMELSEDPGSAANGGSLGYFPRGMMVQEFEDTAFATEIGQISEIVQSQFGYHIIMVDDKQTVSSMIEAGEEEAVVEQYKSSIIGTLFPEAYEAKLTELEDAASVDRSEDNINALFEEIG